MIFILSMTNEINEVKDEHVVFVECLGSVGVLACKLKEVDTVSKLGIPRIGIVSKAHIQCIHIFSAVLYIQ